MTLEACRLIISHFEKKSSLGFKINKINIKF